MRITDWDDAYANRDHIEDAETYVTRWPQDAAAFRADLLGQGRAELDLAYGAGTRNRFDLFRPEKIPEGLVVFVHGGYWRTFDKNVWSRFAAGPLNQGWAVAMPSYTLAPEVPIDTITDEIGAAIEEAAAQIPGPIRLAGHSAGGHLVTRQVCADTALSPAVLQRIQHVVSISGVHDLRPLLMTTMNDDLRLDVISAAAESPALLVPVDGARVTVWVGGDERPEFVRQSTLLANIWTGLGADMTQVKEPDRHHFDVIDGLLEGGSDLTYSLLS
ncbi:MAG: alpha/beta hydrolase [Pseudomonadota bacterium]